MLAMKVTIVPTTRMELGAALMFVQLMNHVDY